MKRKKNKRQRREKDERGEVGEKAEGRDSGRTRKRKEESAQRKGGKQRKME